MPRRRWHYHPRSPALALLQSRRLWPRAPVRARLTRVRNVCAQFRFLVVVLAAFAAAAPSPKQGDSSDSLVKPMRSNLVVRALAIAASRASSASPHERCARS